MCGFDLCDTSHKFYVWGTMIYVIKTVPWLISVEQLETARLQTEARHSCGAK